MMKIYQGVDPWPKPMGAIEVGPPQYAPAEPGTFGASAPIDPNAPDKSTVKRKTVYTW